jgi:hypothetical protein
MEQESEPWQSGAAGPCVTIESPAGPVELWVLGNQCYRVKAPSGEQVVEGFQQSRKVAHELVSSMMKPGAVCSPAPTGE